MLFTPFERMVAFRYLRARRSEGFISVIAGFSLLGIALGVATLIIVMAVMNGFRDELLTRILGLNGHATVRSIAGSMADFDPLADRLRVADGVVTIAPIVEGQVMATANRRAAGAVVRGIRPGDLRAREIVSDNIVEGSLDEFGQDGGIAVGGRLARNLGLKIGDRVNLVAPEGSVTLFGTVPRMAAYPIVAIFRVGMFEYDNTFIFMPLESAQTFFRQDDSVSFLEVYFDNPEFALTAVPALQDIAGVTNHVLDWQRLNYSFFNALQVERNVMFLILTLIILVAAFNIISSLIMLVKDKGRDIAILRTMGATSGSVLRIFFICGASIGVIGTLTGFGLGIAFATNIESIRQALQSLTGTELFAAEIYFLSRLPAVIDWTEVASVVLMGLGLSFLATAYPAWRAARLDPVEALRYE
ncbi:MAG: lipoprotein-releasing ABC transporter permease subunit [Alphaproteobacteria bacterium]|nr:lipoprotein-releasing ABC transporter permease subunit [Alphaproteobacteria bacterium]